MSEVFGGSDDTLAGEDVEKYWNTTSSIVFLVDATEPMHQNDYLQLCFKTYKNIVRQKCSSNKKDKMGLVVFGTEDSNCQVDNVRVLQKFETVTIDTLKNINTEWQDSIGTSSYPLYNAFLHVLQTLNAAKTTSKSSNTILLCTCRDNPNFDSSVERRRIEHLVSSFKDSNIKLLVAGLGNLFNDEIFYKDLQIISGTFTDNDYRRFDLKNLELSILNPARTVGTLLWKITSNLSVPVSLVNLISKSKFPSKIKLQKDNNEVLQTHRILKEDDSQNIFIDELKESMARRKVVREENILHYQTYCGLNITFKPQETKKIKNLCSEMNIELLAFKPIACDPLYHAKPPYFVTSTKICNHETKMLFKSFVSKCSRKKVMPICKISTNYAFFIGMMIPSEDDGGFYMYKMPYNNKVRNLDSRLGHFIFNSEKQCPINMEAVYIFKKLIGLSNVKFEPVTFKNPKLEKYLAHIEALALDEKLGPLPQDSTLPLPVNAEVEKLSKSLTILLDLKDKTANKRSKLDKQDGNKRQKLDIKAVIESKKLHTLTVVELKEILKDVKQSTLGNKSNLIERIYKYYNK